MSKAKWGDRIPHIERGSDGTERWVVDGKPVDLPGVALAGAAMPDRALDPQRWEDVPGVAYKPSERLTAMDVDGVDYSVLYPAVAGRAGETFGRLEDAALELTGRNSVTTACQPHPGGQRCDLWLKHADEEDKWGWGIRFDMDRRGQPRPASVRCLGSG